MKSALSIRKLDPGIASRIAAGEVIERPVSAAKELLENAIDAAATDIRIALEQGGKASLVIEDNGCGIPFAELPLAMERYATSKIATLEDLERVRTLGYRGEALSSIAAVSRMELRSRSAGEAVGGLLRVEGGVLLSHVETNMSPGTRIQVDDLFYNLPARRKFLKSPTAELKRIIQILQDYALVHPHIRFRLSNDGKTLLDIGDGRSTLDVLKSLWGEEHRGSEAQAERGDLCVRLWWNALPGSRRVNVTVFVNGRRVQDATIRSALNSTGATIHGEWVVMVDLPPEEVDVNIHPAKAEVRFRKTGPIFEAVRRGASDLLLKGGGFASDSGGSADSGDAMPAIRVDPWENYVPPPPSFGPKMPPFFSPSPLGPASAPSQPDVPASGTLFREETDFSARRYLGQVQGGYLVFDDPRGLCLVDAHAAHERILYEKIESAYCGRDVPQQQLVFPQEIPTALEPNVVLYREVLAGMGFSFRLPETPEKPSDAPAIVSVPAVRGLGRLSPVEMLRSALRGIEEESDPSKQDREVWWRWARTACRDAVKLGTTLSREEALDLFDRLERCHSPYSCPHGRPTTIFVAGEKLRSWFER